MPPEWLQHYLDEEETTATRVEVVWEGKHVALLKKKRPVRWAVTDKEYGFYSSPARGEVFEGKPILEADLRTGRLSAPDFERLVNRVKELDAKYPELVAAVERKQAAYRKRIEAEKAQARKREQAAKKRANALCRALKAAGIKHNRYDTNVMGGSIKLTRIEMTLPNGIYIDISSKLDGFGFSQLRLDNHGNVDDPEAVVKIVKAINRLRIPKGK